MDWDTADFIGNELDDVVRDKVKDLALEFEVECYIKEGGYSILSKDYDKQRVIPDGIELYFIIGVKE